MRLKQAIAMEKAVTVVSNRNGIIRPALAQILEAHTNARTRAHTSLTLDATFMLASHTSTLCNLRKRSSSVTMKLYSC